MANRTIPPDPDGSLGKRVVCIISGHISSSISHSLFHMPRFIKCFVPFKVYENNLMTLIAHVRIVNKSLGTNTNTNITRPCLYGASPMFIHTYGVPISNKTDNSIVCNMFHRK